MQCDNGVNIPDMKYVIALLLFFSTPAYAQLNFGGMSESIQGPRGMMVQGSSVIDDDPEDSRNNSDDSAVQETRDDAMSMMDKDKPAPAMQKIDPFQPAPQPQTKQNVKRVLKKMPATKVERSIADDRIDDSYVQQMIKNNLDFTGPIE